MSTEGPTTGNTSPVKPAADQAAPHAPLSIIYAGIGLLSLMADALPALLERSVQRGDRLVHQTQAEARARYSARRPRPSARVSRRASEEWQTQIDRLGLPTRQEIEALNQQIDELGRQIDELAARHTTAT